MNILVNTRFNRDMIVSEIERHQPDGTVDLLVREVVMLREDGIRKALIALGWTPPA